MNQSLLKRGATTECPSPKPGVGSSRPGDHNYPPFRQGPARPRWLSYPWRCLLQPRANDSETLLKCGEALREQVIRRLRSSH